MKRFITVMTLTAAFAIATVVIVRADAQSSPSWLSPQQVLERQRNEEALVVDVRTPAEFSAGHLSGAVNVPLGEVERSSRSLASQAAGRPIILYCRSGRRARVAEEILRHQGFREIYHLQGQLSGWVAEGLPVER